MKSCAKNYGKTFKSFYKPFYFNPNTDEFIKTNDGWVLKHGCPISRYTFSWSQRTKIIKMVHYNFQKEKPTVLTKKIHSIEHLNNFIQARISQCHTGGPKSLAWWGWINQDITPYLPKRKDQQKEVLKYYDMLNRHPQ